MILPSREFLERLNAEQRQAVTHARGPLLVLAGAGTGKTSVVTSRIAHLLREGVPARAILAVTFTRKAGAEMKERAAELVGATLAREMRISTFHSFGLSILRAHHEKLGLPRSFRVADDATRLALCTELLSSLPEAAASKASNDSPASHASQVKDDAQNYLRQISAAKSCGHGMARSHRMACSLRPQMDDFGFFYAAYNKLLTARALVDFDDLLLLPLELLEQTPALAEVYREQFRHILVDEYQDANELQYRLIQACLGAERNITVVGDDDQAIYAFRGAKRELILRFREDFPGARVVALTTNYRSSSNIVRVANAVIHQSSGRFEKQLSPARERGLKVVHAETASEDSEHRYIADSIATLQGASLRDYRDVAVLVREKTHGAAIAARLRARDIPCGSTDGVSVMTLHASKGLEFPVVFLPAVEEDSLPHWNAVRSGATAVEEERRLFYVGITRAQDELYLSSARGRRNFPRKPSRFLAGLSEAGLLDQRVPV